MLLRPSIEDVFGVATVQSCIVLLYVEWKNEALVSNANNIHKFLSCIIYIPTFNRPHEARRGSQAVPAVRGAVHGCQQTHGPGVAAAAVGEGLAL